MTPVWCFSFSDLRAKLELERGLTELLTYQLPMKPASLAGIMLCVCYLCMPINLKSYIVQLLENMWRVSKGKDKAK